MYQQQGTYGKEKSSNMQKGAVVTYIEKEQKSD